MLQSVLMNTPISNYECPRHSIVCAIFQCIVRRMPYSIFSSALWSYHNLGSKRAQIRVLKGFNKTIKHRLLPVWGQIEPVHSMCITPYTRSQLVLINTHSFSLRAEQTSFSIIYSECHPHEGLLIKRPQQFLTESLVFRDFLQPLHAVTIALWMLFYIKEKPQSNSSAKLFLIMEDPKCTQRGS